MKISRVFTVSRLTHKRTTLNDSSVYEHYTDATEAMKRVKELKEKGYCVKLYIDKL
jgi:hypothetical protein